MSTPDDFLQQMKNMPPTPAQRTAASTEQQAAQISAMRRELAAEANRAKEAEVDRVARENAREEARLAAEEHAATLATERHRSMFWATFVSAAAAAVAAVAAVVVLLR